MTNLEKIREMGNDTYSIANFIDWTMPRVWTGAMLQDEKIELIQSWLEAEYKE